MKYLLPGALVLAALVNLAPVVGVISNQMIVALYGISLESSDLAILMRHRAILFGLVGGFILLSVFRPALRPLAITAALTSMLSFVALAMLIGDYSQKITRLMVGDLIASVVLIIAVGITSAAERGK